MNILDSKFKIKDFFPLLKETAIKWNSDNPFRLGAVVAYYAVLSLPGLMVLLINMVGFIWGKEIVAGQLTNEIASAIGTDAATAIQSMVSETQGENKTLISSIIGIATLVFGATGVFYQLQLSLNEIFEIKIDPDAGVLKVVTDRARGFGFILVIGFLLLTSFVVSAGINILSDYIIRLFPDVFLYLAFALNLVLSLSIIAILFSLIFKYLPDIRTSWKTVLPGAIITSILFVLGKELLGFYFGKADPASAYGAAGSIVLILLWVSYSCLILFFGAEFTWVYAKKYSCQVVPNKNAIQYKEKEVVVSKGCDIPDEDCEEEK